MSNLELLSAGLSAIFGTDMVPQAGGEFSIYDLFNQTHVMRPHVQSLRKDDSDQMFNVFVLFNKTTSIGVTGNHTIAEVKAEIERKEGLPKNQMRLVYSGKQLKDERTVKEYGIQPDDTIFLLLCLRGGGPPLTDGDRSLSCSFNTDELDPKFDFDFSCVQDDGKRYMRGGFEYKRPYGWERFAIKVVGRFENDAWLGPNGIRTAEAPGEWPVSYHGTNMSSAKLILKEGYKPGSRAKFGKGIYSSPSLEMVEKLYAQEFTRSGKTYKIVLQNRVNPDQKNGHLQVIPASQTTVGADYWLSPSATDVRPYGILIREVVAPYSWCSLQLTSRLVKVLHEFIAVLFS